MHILHLNDNNLLIQTATAVVASQGYAWLKGESVLFDCTADLSPVGNCRLAPQEINSRYWQQCEQSAIAANEAGMRHAADLIWKHLIELKNAYDLRQVVLVVPSHYQPANLSLLLGIAKACELEVVGLLNKAVLAVGSQAVQSGEFLHIDVQLHQTVTSAIMVDAGVAKLGAVDVIPSVGIHSMQDALLKALQSQFIQSDRFDPLHYAETEQQLFDQLSDAAQQIAVNGKATVSVQQNQQLHSASIDKGTWAASLQSYAAILNQLGSSADAVLLDLNAAFGEQGLEGVHLGKHQLITNPSPFDLAVSISAMAEGEKIAYTTELLAKPDRHGEELSAEASVPKPAQAASLNSNPTGATHLMQAGIAIPIEHSHVATENNELLLHTRAKGNAQAMLEAGKLYVMNDESRKTLKPNDRLGSQLGEGVITVIQVV